MNQETNKGGSNSPLKSKPLIFSAIAIVLIALLVIVLTPGDSTTASTAYYEAKRGEFLITIVEGGSLQAVKETTIRSDVEGTARVISIVPEGTYVRKDDILVELDSGSAEDQRNQQEISVRNAELAVTNAFEQINIGMSQTNSDITAAAISLELAKIDLEKFKEGELAQSRRELELNVETADADRVLAEQTYRFSTNLFANDFETKSNVDRDRINWLKAEKGYVNATNALWMFIEFDQKKSLREFESKVEEAEEEVKRVVFQSQAQMAQYHADLLTKQRTLELNKEKLARDIKNVEGCIIRAPSDGLVVYPESRSRFSSESMIEEGATVRYRQDLIKLPDTSQMKLTIKVHESHVGNVQQGQPAFVVLDPMPDKQFRGTVSKVAIMPNTADRWSNPNLKVYDTEIILSDTLPDTVKPGVSAKAEIIIAKLEDVITVPVQAVTTLKGKSVVYLAGKEPKPVPVEVGMFNTKMIQIVSGVNDGDRVLLSPPLDSGEGSIDGTIIEEGMDIEITNTISLANNSTDTSASAPPAEGGQRQQRSEGSRSGAPGGGGFDREAMMQQYDTNGDGELDETERAAMRSAMQERFGGGGGGSSREGGETRGEGGTRGGGGFDREAMMQRFDTDGDGTLSDSEREAMRSQFGGGSRGGGGGNRQRDNNE